MCTLKILKYGFVKRDILTILLRIEKALKLTPSDENISKKVNGLPLVVTYNPAFRNLAEGIRKNPSIIMYRQTG